MPTSRESGRGRNEMRQQEARFGTDALLWKGASMAENSRIGWTHHTMNFWWGCHKVTKECDNCYIGPIMKRGGHEPFEGPMATTTSWSNPARWNRLARQAGERHR